MYVKQHCHSNGVFCEMLCSSNRIKHNDCVYLVWRIGIKSKPMMSLQGITMMIINA